jgi:hypothetical protein
VVRECEDLSVAGFDGGRFDVGFVEVHQLESPVDGHRRRRSRLRFGAGRETPSRASKESGSGPSMMGADEEEVHQARRSP